MAFFNLDTAVWLWIKAHPYQTTFYSLAAIILGEMLIKFILDRAFGWGLEAVIGKTIFYGISLVLVTLTYCTVVAMTAIVMKLRGRHLLPEGANAVVQSYWSPRAQVEPSLKHLKRQF